MADNNSNVKKEIKPKKSNKKELTTKANILFFILMIIGLIFFTIMLLIKSNSKTYEANFGDNIKSTVKLSGSDKIEINAKVDDIISIQSGTYKEITDDDISNNYIITIDNDNKDSLEMIVDETTLTLKYEDGSIIEYKEIEYE